MWRILRPLALEGGEIECVRDFKYLGSIVEEKGGVVKEVGERIAKAFRAFGLLKEPIFKKEFQPFLQKEKTCLRSGCFGDHFVWISHKAFQCEEDRGFLQ